MVQRNRPTQVLLIEDSPGDAWLIRDILTKGAVPKEVHLVTDGDRALRFLRRLGEYAAAPRPDLVLLDVNLPGRNGLDVLREIKSDPALRTITVIVLTTSDALNDVNTAYDLNANCYVVKPLDLVLFTQAIRGIEEFWLRMAMLPVEGSQGFPRSSAQNAGRTGNGPSACIHQHSGWAEQTANKRRVWQSHTCRPPHRTHDRTDRKPSISRRHA